MVFSSLAFVFMYLPIVILLFYITPKKFRNLLLFVVNLVFYGWGEPIFVLLMLFSTLVDYVHGIFIAKYRVTNKKKAKLFLISSVVINLSLLGFFKYAGFISNTLDIVFPFLDIPIISVPLPIGISFYTFQTMSYSIDIYRGDADAQKNIISFGTYVSLFPQLIAGPIVRYKDIETQLNNNEASIDYFSHGIKLFIVGLAKKVLIANQMGLLWDTLRVDYANNGIITSWIAIIAYTFQIYFDFSGYSDMACGLGNMFGFSFLKNFDYPYISKSITEFWRRWHISLHIWFKEYVYIPLGGSRKGNLRLIINMLIVWGLTGLWHGASYNFILWGLYFGLILIIEKFFLLKYLIKAPAFISHIYSLFLIIFGWAIFFYSDDCGGLNEMLSFMKSLFSGSLITADSLSIILNFLPLLIIAGIASTPLIKIIYQKIQRYSYSWIVDIVLTLGVLVLVTSCLVNQSYNPFLYFRF